MEKNNIIFTRMTDIREDLDLTQCELADYFGIKQGVYSRWEKGKEIIPLRRLNQFANLTKNTLDYICGLTFEKRPGVVLDEIDPEEVGRRLRQFRKSHKITQSELANYLNTTQSTISAYEKGRALILTAFIIQIAKQYEVSIDWLCGRSDEPQVK